ncbi:hypothetical protein [uncultured Streptomyces sp.]|uniref:hypothetical protein n=1 Tax=uncultured Streptomyces sp. TaxID=174707 RepID=UPI00262E5ACA|nr:hypothetical protein [uncultured Streptomyces sp.]
MSAVLLAAAEPRRIRGGAGGVRFNRPRRRSEQTVWIPEALYRGHEFNDEAVSVYAKVAALDARRSFPGARPGQDPCTAHVSELADTLGMSASAVERGLTHLNRPGPDGDEPWLFTKQRTHRGGKGRSALRYARLVPRTQAALEVPVMVAEALSPRRFRAYLHLARATAKHLPVTGAELAGELFHHTGKAAGKPLGPKTGLRLLDDLEASGWISLGRRAGERGRHTVTVHTHPLHAVPADDLPAARAPQPSADTHDGSGPADHDGSLASKEDTSPSTDGVGQVDLGIRRRRNAGSYRATPVENPVAGPTVRRAAHGEKRSSANGGTYRGPGLQLSPRVWRVLEPVRHHLPEISTYVLRRIGQDIGRQLCAGTGEERLTDRLRLRYALTDEPRDIGRWILGAALVRHGCHLDSCESGFTWTTGAPCPGCYDPGAAAAAIEEPSPAPAPPPPPPPPVPPADSGRWLPWPPPAPPPPDPGSPPGDSPDDVRRFVAEHGAAAAIRTYGGARVLPHLT